jgi:hypothetical protein
MPELSNLQNPSAMVESFKMIQDWTKSLITIELAICTGLWTKLTAVPKPPSVMFVSCYLFVASVVCASLVLVIVSRCVSKYADSGEAKTKVLNILLVGEILFFVLGVLALTFRIAQIWLSL